MRSQWNRATHIAVDTALTGGFLMLWLLCWPFYRLYRSHWYHL